MCTSLFCSQVFKTTSNVLNSDVNNVNIALIAFCSLAVTNLAHWATSSLRQWNAIYQNPVKAKTNDNCVTNYRPASDPHESKGGEIRYKILRFAQHFWVDVSRFSPCVINLSGNKNVRWSFDVGWGKLLRKVERRSTLALFLVCHQTYNWSRNKFSHVARQIEGFCISYFSPPLLSCGSLADRLLQLSFVLALLWLNSV